MYERLELYFMCMSELKSGFWNFSKNRLAVTRDLPGDTSVGPIFWVSSLKQGLGFVLGIGNNYA